ncbi:MAG TPA: ECF-type sigma factor [Gemmatimonadales bacterium]|jgi:RNA polymerase sigma factor (TIGR02999 family)|nr:ECF-type sigma factor [Gemmatimonadales bacterium]
MVDNDVSTLVEAVASGDQQALDALFPLVYEELNRLAHQQRRRWDGDFTLTTTALVHEAYLKLAGQRQLPTASRAHFLAIASKAMRHILCNYARDRRRQKRGGGQPHLSLEQTEVAEGSTLDLAPDQADRLAGLDEAMRRFEGIAGRQCRVVECRFFGGMSVEETAAALGMSPRSVKRDWAFARAWLLREMQLTLGSEA